MYKNHLLATFTRIKPSKGLKNSANFANEFVDKVILFFSFTGDALYFQGTGLHANQHDNVTGGVQVIKFNSLCFTDIGNASFLNIKPESPVITTTLIICCCV